MTISAEKAAFIKNEYRWATAENPVVLDRDNSAQTVDVPANVDEDTAEALAAAILAQNDTPRVYNLLISGIMTVDDFIGGVPRFIVDAPTFSTDGRTQRVMSATCDLNNATTTVKVHG